MDVGDAGRRTRASDGCSVGCRAVAREYGRGHLLDVANWIHDGGARYVDTARGPQDGNRGWSDARDRTPHEYTGSGLGHLAMGTHAHAGVSARPGGGFQSADDRTARRHWHGRG